MKKIYNEGKWLIYAERANNLFSRYGKCRSHNFDNTFTTESNQRNESGRLDVEQVLKAFRDGGVEPGQDSGKEKFEADRCICVLLKVFAELKKVMMLKSWFLSSGFSLPPVPKQIGCQPFANDNLRKLGDDFFLPKNSWPMLAGKGITSKKDSHSRST